MDDPVLLPDGYVYDRTTALVFLEMVNGSCPMNPQIKFTEEDMTPCHFVISVIEQLKENILEKIKAAKQDGIKASSVPKMQV